MDKNRYLIKNNSLFKDNTPLILCNDNIEQYLILENSNIVILLANKMQENSENVYCYSSKGEFVWRIYPVKKISGLNYYTSIYLRNGDLMAYNFNGFEVLIDKSQGTILREEFIK